MVLEGQKKRATCNAYADVLCVMAHEYNRVLQLTDTLINYSLKRFIDLKSNLCQRQPHPLFMIYVKLYMNKLCDGVSSKSQGGQEPKNALKLTP